MARMLRIHEALQAERWPNCTSLSEQFEVSAKTIQRDLEFMRDQLGLPLEYEPSRRGYGYTAPVGAFPSMKVTEGEVLALFVAQKALLQYKGTPFERPLASAFEKLAAAMPEEIEVRPQDLAEAVSFRATGTVQPDLAHFEVVSRAVMESRELAFTYTKLAAQQPERRRVRPYHIGCVENQWYLWAYDLDREGLRTFVLGRIAAVEAPGARFDRPADFDLDHHLRHSFGVFLDPAGGPHEVAIRFDAWAARLVRERSWHASQRIEKHPDGGLTLHLTLASLEEVKRWALSWGTHARVLKPAGLCDYLSRTALRLAAAYLQATPEAAEGLWSLWTSDDGQLELRLPDDGDPGQQGHLAL